MLDFYGRVNRPIVDAPVAARFACELKAALLEGKRSEFRNLNVKR